MKKSVMIGGIIGIVVIAIAAAIFIQHRAPTTANAIGLPSGVQAVTLTSITYDNLPSELAKTDIVKALPSDSAILLKFYNFNTGHREWEKSYLLQKGKVAETAPDAGADIVLTLHSKYLSGLTNQNFCSVIQKANANGDLGFDTTLSKTQILWKFKSVLGYKSCFGL